jgi:hypothetical protein
MLHSIAIPIATPIPTPTFRVGRSIFEADPMACTCGAHMPVVSLITGLRTAERIPSYRESERWTAKILSTRATRPDSYRRR